MKNRNKQSTDIYVTVRKNGKEMQVTVGSEEMAERIARNGLLDGAQVVEKLIYKSHDVRETKRMTQKKPYWH